MFRRFCWSVMCFLLCPAAFAQTEKPGPAAPAPPPLDPAADSRIHLVRETGGHAARPQHLVFTPDGTRLISAAEDRTVQVWDVVTGERLRVIRPPVGLDDRGGLSERAYGPHLVVDRQGEQVAFCTEARDDKGVVVFATFVCSLETGQAQVVKGTERFKLAGDWPAALRKVRVPPAVVTRLNALKNQEPATGEAFRSQLAKILNAEELAGCLSKVLTVARVATVRAFAPDGKALALGTAGEILLVDIATR
jgi:hypothetical protein